MSFIFNGTKIVDKTILYNNILKINFNGFIYFKKLTIIN